MSDENRFSIVLLEKDILEYREFKNKYNIYEKKMRSWLSLIYKSSYEEKRNLYYNKYLKKMRYLERKYRCNNIYTKYHSDLEGNNALPAYEEHSHKLPQAVIVPETYEMSSAPPPPRCTSGLTEYIY